jgi:hypothetical protein
MLGALLLSGCVMSWQAQPAPPAEVIRSTGESEVRVTMNSGTSVVLREILRSRETAWSAGNSHR